MFHAFEPGKKDSWVINIQTDGNFKDNHNLSVVDIQSVIVRIPKTRAGSPVA